MDDSTRKEIQKMINEAIERSLQFPVRKLGDTPTDAYQLTPRKYVTMNGSVAGRPNSSIATAGQFYLSTDTTKPMWYTTNNNWVDGVGSVIASN